MDSPSLFIRKVKNEQSNIVFEKDMLQMIQDLIKKFEDELKVNLENDLIKECLIKELKRLKIEEKITIEWMTKLNHPFV